jgi:hypothetical protein
MIASVGSTIVGASTGLMRPWQACLGRVSAALSFISWSVSPSNVEGAERVAILGLVDRLEWIAGIVALASTSCATDIGRRRPSSVFHLAVLSASA